MTTTLNEIEVLLPPEQYRQGRLGGALAFPRDCLGAGSIVRFREECHGRPTGRWFAVRVEADSPVSTIYGWPPLASCDAPNDAAGRV